MDDRAGEPGYAQSFGTPAADPYLAKTLPRRGALLENYYAIGHASADNYIAQVSGQAPTLATQADCPLRTPFPGHVVAGPYHQLPGEGCVYPAGAPTLGNQLSAAGRSWAAYLQDMGNDPGRDNTVSTARGPACGHPATWSVDRTRHAERGDQYAVRHDGFTFFHSITADRAFCAAHILSFRPLPGDLARASATPAFSFIAPDLCNDGHDAPCADGAPGGLAHADAFLSRWVPIIMAAPAYRDGGLIVITFDEGSDAAACCGETSGISPSHPNVALPGKTGPGGGRIGAVLLSPLIRPGTVSTIQYNHYSLLRSIEDIFGLTTVKDGRRRIISEPPLIVPLEELAGHLDVDVVYKFLRALSTGYAQTLPAYRRRLVERFTLTAAARKVVGVGSVGTETWILLMEPEDGLEPLLLQAKEAQRSVLADYADQSEYLNQAERVVAGQHLMQAASDIFLGWQRAPLPGRRAASFYYVRQLRDWKYSAAVGAMNAAAMTGYGRMCGWTLARAHARTGDRIAIAAYLGGSDEFDQAVAEFAETYADQTERDHAALADAVASGRVQAQEGI